MPAHRAGVVAWAVVVVTALAYGTYAVDGDAVMLRAAPLMGRWGWRWDAPHAGVAAPAAALGAALAVGGAVAWWGPRHARTLSWRALLWATGATAAAWTVTLAASDGWQRLTSPLATRHEYEPYAAGVDDLGALVSGYVAGLRDRPIHVQGHPPGPVVLAWLADRAGLGGAGWLAALAIAGWGVAAAAVLVAARAVAGEGAARRAAPALAVLPAAVWAGTSLDALFAGLAAAGCALAVVALVRGSAPRAAAAGAVLGVTLLCSYGAAVILVVPAAIALVLAGRQGWRAVARGAAAAAAGGLAVLAAAGVAGFWWFDGLAATRAAYWDGAAGLRPGWYLTLLGNPAALALATGPAVAAGLAAAGIQGLTAARSRSAALLPAAALAAVLVADLSQLSRGEVERIWLPFVPWLALAAPGHRRGWLAAQVAVGLGLQLLLRSPW